MGYLKKSLYKQGLSFIYNSIARPICVLSCGFLGEEMVVLWDGLERIEYIEAN
jgi:hypothetical protein